MRSSEVNEVELADCLLFTTSLEPSSSAATETPVSSSISHENEMFTSFDMFGTCSVQNIKRTIRINKALKPLRLYLLKQVLRLCQEAHIEPFVYGGTALSVFRENGQMIPHDTDIDLAVLEYDNDTGQGAFSKLGTYCLNNSVSVVGVENMEQAKCDSLIHVNLLASITKKVWLRRDPFTQEISEISYNGSDCKRAKFYFTQSGLKQVCDQFGLKPQHFQNILSDPGLVHVDLFTLSKHPNKPDTHLRVNWNLPFIYDCNRKQFPISAIIPLRQCTFEQIHLMAPANLELYLTIEYGYLGRDAQYDNYKQLYVPIPSKFTSELPKYMELDAISHTNRQTFTKP